MFSVYYITCQPKGVWKGKNKSDDNNIKISVKRDREWNKAMKKNLLTSAFMLSRKFQLSKK